MLAVVQGWETRFGVCQGHVCFLGVLSGHALPDGCVTVEYELSFIGQNVAPVIPDSAFHVQNS